MKMDKNKIKQTIPYSEPFLWVDEIEDIKDNEIVGYKSTLPSDPYFKGHFVDFPIMPGVLVVEGIAQTATILLRKKIGPHHKQKHLLAYQVKNAQFYSPVFPGDKIKYRVQFLNLANNKIANFRGQALVDNKKKCKVEFSMAIIDKDHFSKKSA